MNEYVEGIQEEEEGISLQDLFKIVLNNIVLIIIIGFWALVLGVVYTFAIVTPKYTANSSVMIQVEVDENVGSDQSALYIANSIKGTTKEFMLSEKVLKSVMDDLNIYNISVSALRNSISISTSNDSLIMSIKVEDESPVMAANINNKLIENSISIANGIYDPSFESLYLKNRLVPFVTADVPVNSSSPNKVLNIIISGILGGIIALGIVFVKEMMNNKFKTAEELEKYLNVKVLATVPGTIKERKVVE